MARQIGFACTTIFHYVHFRRIASLFENQVRFIVATPKYTNDRHEKMAAFFEENRIAWCEAHDLICGKVQVDAIVAPYFLPLLHFVDPAVPRIRVLYGYAKDAWNYADWNTGFDLALVYGPYASERLRSMVPVVEIGHPRYQGPHAGPQSDVMGLDGRKLSAWLAGSDRKTVLFCPTWGGLSSFQWFRQCLDGLLADFRVIVKLHHGISLSRDFQYRDLSGDHLFLCDETADLFDLFPVSDLVISDYSGAIFDTMLAGNRLLLINCIPSDVKDTGVYNINKMNNIGKLGRTDENGAESLDIQIRRWLPTVDEPEAVAGKVKELLAQPAMDYGAMNRQLYAWQDSRAPERAHAAITEFLTRGGRQRRAEHPGRFRMEQLRRFADTFRDSPFVVWGAGDYGQLMVSWLKHAGIRVASVLDMQHEKQGKLLHGVPITSPETFTFGPDDKLIVSFPGDRDELAACLRSMGMGDANWIMPID